LLTLKSFNEIGGFSGNTKIASGDDVFLLQKALKSNAKKVQYLKNTDTIVKTKPENDLFELFMQRVRWASKTSSYDAIYSKTLAVVVLLMNLSLLIGLYLVFDKKLSWTTLIWVFSVKYFVDYILLFKSNQFLRKRILPIPLASSLFYPLFSSLVGVYSLFGVFTWKGRSFKK
jgi:hypothetical protein